MAIPLIERLGIHPGLTPALAKPLAEDAILEPEDLIVEPVNIYHAEKLAQYVERSGGERFPRSGWKELSLPLAEPGRTANLQVSLDTLEINIPPTEANPVDTHIHWDRERNILNTYREWDPKKNTSLVNFQISGALPTVPRGFSYADASRKFSGVLMEIKLRASA